MSEDREQLRITILDFIADPMCEEDEAAWKRHLNTYDELLAEVKRLRKQLVAHTDFVLWVEEEHNEVFDEYERKDEL
tara:strand:- start:2255 stop:2485 length:231 start_codon:yes stop_codon:yes gene_type:complete